MTTNSIVYSIAIPVLNEKENIYFVYRGLKKAAEALGKEFEIIFVDDGSRDSSIETLNREIQDDVHVEVIELKRHFGKSFALQSAFQRARGQYIVTLDGDGQYDPGDIRLLLKKIEEENFDAVCGWRKHRSDPFFKIITSQAANYLRRLVFNESIHDVGCSLRIYSRRALENISLKGEQHRFITAILKRKGFTIGEVIVRHYPRLHGKSKYGILDRLVKSIPEFLSLIVIRGRH